MTTAAPNGNSDVLASTRDNDITLTATAKTATTTAKEKEDPVEMTPAAAEEEEGVGSTAAAVDSEDGEAKDRFLCGVIEGFYGKPWTKDQRTQLFRRMKDLGLNSYIYAPKDDYKHRAFWRDAYSSAELSELSSLITEAKSNQVAFHYAISPGIDILFSSERDVNCLKKKLQQMQLCGCDGFAILFDDIDPELSPVDSAVFTTFGHAQAAVTNDVFQYLGEPKTFLFCPTEYCATRAVPNVATSEYLRTLGEKLHPNIDVMWTGPQVISREISVSSIQQVSKVIRRHPVIWDNYHANDYDQSRVFLGPLDGRPPELKQTLRGFFANPNCEFYANWVAFHSLATWSKTSVSLSNAADRHETIDDTDSGAKNVENHDPSASAAEVDSKDVVMTDSAAMADSTNMADSVAVVEDTKQNSVSNDDAMTTTTTITATTTKSIDDTSVKPLALAHPFDAITASAIEAMDRQPAEVYIPERALFRALEAWLPEFRLFVDADGKRPSADGDDEVKTLSSSTSMSACESTASAVDDSSPATAAAAAASSAASEPHTDLVNDVASGLVKHAAVNGAVAALSVEPMDCASSPSSPKPSPATVAATTSTAANAANPEVDPMQVDVTEAAKTGVTATADASSIQASESTLTNSSNLSSSVESNETNGPTESSLSVDDLLLFADLYHAPFSYGPRGAYMLSEFKWLKANVCLVTREISAMDRCKAASAQHQFESKRYRSRRPASSTTPAPAAPACSVGGSCCEATQAARIWHARAHALIKCCHGVKRLYRHLCNCQNRPLLYELLPYLRNILYIVNLLLSYVKWMGGTGGLEKKFLGSGVQEPWVFRGGLVAEFQRLLPSHSLLDFDALTARPIRELRSGRQLGGAEGPPNPALSWATTNFLTNSVRPYFPVDKLITYEICKRSPSLRDFHGGIPPKACPNKSSSSSSSSDAPAPPAPPLPPPPPPAASLRRSSDLCGDLLIGAFLAHASDLIYVVEDDVGVFGFCCGVADAQQFLDHGRVSWVPEMLNKYGKAPPPSPAPAHPPPPPPQASTAKGSGLTDASVEEALRMRILSAFGNPFLPPPEILAAYPGLLRLEFLPRGADNFTGGRSLVHTFKLALASRGCKGVHCLVTKAAGCENSGGSSGGSGSGSGSNSSGGSGKLDFMLDLGFERLSEVSHEGVLYNLVGLKIEPM